MNAIMKTPPILLVTVCLFALGTVVGAQTQAPTKEGAANPNPELVRSLAKTLKVTPDQATGGAGAIFALAKSRLNPADFSKVAAAVPGMDGFLKAAPAVGGGPGLGSLGSVLPGRAGGLASLAGSFKSLGLSPTMASKFAPVLQKYIGSKGGSNAAALFAGALK